MSGQDVLEEAYEKDLIAKVELILHSNDIMHEMQGHGVLCYMPTRPTAVKRISSLHVESIPVTKRSDIVSACDYIAQVNLGYSFDTLRDVIAGYIRATNEYKSALAIYKENVKRRHRLLTLSKNTKLQREWLKKENNDRDLKKSGAAREIDDINEKLTEIDKKIENNNENSKEAVLQLGVYREEQQEKRNEVMRLNAEAYGIHQSIKLSDRVLHPFKSNKEHKHELELSASAQKMQGEVDSIGVSIEKTEHSIQSLKEEIEFLRSEKERLEHEREVSKSNLTKSSSDLSTGEVMIKKEDGRLKELEEKQKTIEAKCRSSEADVERTFHERIVAAGMVLSTWVGYSDAYQAAIQQLKETAKGDEEIPANLLSALFFAPNVFVASGSTALGYMRNRGELIAGTLVSTCDISEFEHEFRDYKK